jgi:hypothetical protein
MSSSDSWTHVGKDGKPVRHSEFPSSAAAAFGSRSGGRAYGSSRNDYDRGSRADGGSRWESDRRPQFSDSAAAAFGTGGGRRDHVPHAPYVPRQYRSAVAESVKPAVVVQPYEEAFPALGGGKAHAKPAAAPTAAVGTAPAKMTFASLVKKTAEEEAAAEELRRYRALKEAEDRKVRERERRLISAIHSRTTYGYTPSNYEDAEDTGYGDDLDHDVYGARKTCYGEVPDVRTEDRYSDDGGDYNSHHSDDY